MKACKGLSKGMQRMARRIKSLQAQIRSLERARAEVYERVFREMEMARKPERNHIAEIEGGRAL